MRKTMQSRTQNFNPRSREGSDVEIKACDYAHAIFQSALPRGERHGASVEYKPTMTTISIRAPARGATKSGKHTVVYSVISIRAPARGATKSRNTSYPGLDISIRAPARGATLFLLDLTV